MEFPVKNSSKESRFNPVLIAYGIVSVVLVVLLFEYVRPSSDEKVSYLSYFIYLIGMIGIAKCYQYYRRVMDERSCAAKTHAEAEKILINIKTSGHEFPLQHFRELGTKDEELSVNRILSHIYTEAESKKFDSGLFILGSYKEEFASRIMRLLGFQKVALQLGILGTFIGLAMAFHDLNNTVIDQHTMDHLLRSLKIPFSTSIAGLQIAFILWLHVDYLLREQEKLFILMEKCVDEVINLARHAIYRDSITIELQHVSMKIDELSGRLEKSNELLLHQSNQIGEGINRLRTANSDLDVFMNGIVDRQKEFLAAVKSLYESLSPQSISKELSQSLTKGAQDISSVMSDHLKGTLGRYSELDKSFAMMDNQLKELSRYLQEQAKKNNESFFTQRSEIFQALQQVVARQSQYAEKFLSMDLPAEMKRVMASSVQTLAKDMESNLARLASLISSLTQEFSAYNRAVANRGSWFRKTGGLLNSFIRNTRKMF